MGVYRYRVSGRVGGHAIWLSHKVLVLAAMTVLGGCADLKSLHLYSPTRDTQGQAAQKAWATANPQGVIQTSLDNYNALLNEQQTTSREGRMAAADTTLMALVLQDGGHSVSTGLSAPIVKELNAVVGSPEVYEALLTAQRKARVFNDNAEARFSVLRQFGAEVSSCGELKGSSAQLRSLQQWVSALKLRRPKSGVEADGVLKNAQEFCLKSDAETGDEAALLDQVAQSAQSANQPPPALFAAMLSARDAERSLTKSKTEHVAERNDYRAARLEFERVLAAPSRSKAADVPASAASKPADVVGAANSNQLTDAITKLQAAFQKLKNFDDKYSLKLLSEARITAIDDLFTSLLKPKSADDPTATDRDRVLQAINTLLDSENKWKLTQAEAQEILGRPLQTQQKVDALQAETLGRSIAADEARVALLKERVAIQLKRASHLNDGYKLLNPVDSAHQPKPLSHPKWTLALSLNGGKDPQTGKRIDPVPADERRRLMQAAGQYLFVQGDLNADLDAVQYKEDALVYANELALSQNHVQQWDALIGGNVDLLAAWSKTGIADDTISKGVNAVLLFWIGLGVN